MTEISQVYLDNHPDAIIIHHQDGEIVYLNQKASKHFGYKQEDLIGKNIFSTLLDISQKEAEKFLSSNVQKNFKKKAFIKTSQDATLFLDMKVSWFLSKDQKELVSRSFENIDNHQEIDWTHNVIDHMRSGVCISDPNLPDNPIIFVNKAFEKMTGYTEEEVMGKNCRFLQGEKTNQPALDVLRQAIKDKKPCHVVLENFKKDGTPFINQLDISVVYNEKGEAIQFVGLQYDITEKIHQQIELAKQKEIAMTASKMAALGEMAGSISHEINNPLMVLRTHIDDISDYLEEQKVLQPDIQESLAKMDETINRVARIVKSLREFSRRSDPQEIACENLNDLIQETLTFCQERIKNENIDLQLNIEDSSDVLMRKIEISQILINLINNAIDEVRDATDKRIILETKISKESCLISVSDFGKGIDPKDKDVIFNPFYTTKLAGKGTGLGLSISKKIMTSHGGTIELSHCKNPTTFTLKLKIKAG